MDLVGAVEQGAVVDPHGVAVSSLDDGAVHEAELRRLISETEVKPRAGERLNVEEVSRRYRLHAERQGRKRSTLQNIESETRVHLVPFFGDRAIDGITPDDIVDLVLVLEDKDLKPKTIRNVVATLSALFNFAKAPGAAGRPPTRARASTCPPSPKRTRSGSSISTRSTRSSSTPARASSTHSTARCSSPRR